VRLPIPPPRQMPHNINGGGTRIRTGGKGFADLCLTTWLCRHLKSGRRDSNPRPPPWQGGVLPLNYFRIHCGWGSWIRTNASRSQSPLPYRLAIPQRIITLLMGRLVGIEPTNARATIWCVNHFAIAAIVWQGQ
jgi:hypothetical protein